MPGPDFPTGGIILGRAGIREAFHTGRGSIAMRGRATIEEIRKDREAIVITEIPYQVNKARMIERIAEMVREKIIEGISDLRDESDRDGVRVVVELKREAMAEIVLNQLYRHTPLQTSFGVNMLALNGGRPMLMNLKDVIAAFIAFREQVIIRRTSFELGKTRERAHVLVGLAIAVANIDEVIALIRARPDPECGARRPDGARLAGARCRAADQADRRAGPQHRRGRHLSPVGCAGPRHPRSAPAAPDRARARQDRRGAGGAGQEHRRSPGDPGFARRAGRLIMRTELAEMKEQFATPRQDRRWRSSSSSTTSRRLIQREDMVVTVTHGGYIKRVPLSTYRAQRRGGKGRAGMAMREEDFVNQVFVADTHRPVLFFSTRGMVYKLKVYRLPLGTPQARGKALVNLLPLQEGETISTVMPLPEDEASWERDRRHVRHRQRLCPAQQALRFRQCQGQRQDRHEVRGGRPADRRRHLHRGQRRAAGGAAAGAASASRSAMCASSAAAPRPACAASGSPTGDEVISLSILHHMDAETAEREAYLRYASGASAAAGEEEGERRRRRAGEAAGAPRRAEGQ